MTALTYRIAIAPRAGFCRRVPGPGARGIGCALGQDVKSIGTAVAGPQALDDRYHAGFSGEMCTS